MRGKRLSDGRNKVKNMPMPIQNMTKPIVFLIKAGETPLFCLFKYMQRKKKIEKEKNLFHFSSVSGIIIAVM